ncbi:hypothetical protein DFQ27_000111, partial [Actinomortierella ambigua]
MHQCTVMVNLLVQRLFWTTALLVTTLTSDGDGPLDEDLLTAITKTSGFMFSLAKKIYSDKSPEEDANALRAKALHSYVNWTGGPGELARSEGRRQSGTH